MKTAVLATLATSAVAFTGQPTTFQTKSSTALSIAKKPLGQSLKYVPCIPVDALPKPGTATSGVAGGLAICI
eukprot:CAMPEP_0113571674 /NCGR_PEP_ID=MMETSP0015_2-20120614/25681_1 /TAXON_ID=2838 /ORGANISM="Odontella" /LENGTH=71 /DNA_ID=CAMNT_0000474643 /DNA_START=491 /DNA_END=703 /DNA_ORIENTATION=+ /assembly_acc=CAM_ASM_000160